MNEITKSTNLINSLDDVKTMAEMMVKTGVFGGNMGEAVVKILAGRELGIGVFSAMNGIYMVKGKPAMSANLLAAKVKSSGKYDYRVAEINDQVCVIDWYQSGEKIGQSKFTRDDARRAGTQNVDKFPQNMLFARALSNGVRFHAPDIFYGVSVYTEGEIVDDESENETPYHIDIEYAAEPLTVIDAETAPAKGQEIASQERPYNAEVFKEKFVAMASRTALANHLDDIGAKERKLIADAIDGLLGDAFDRSMVLEYLTGKGDLEVMGKHYLKSLCKVMDISETQPAPSPISMIEIKSIYDFLTKVGE